MEGGGCVRNARCKKRAGLIGPDTKTTGRAKHQGGGVGGGGQFPLADYVRGRQNLPYFTYHPRKIGCGMLHDEKTDFLQ